MCVCAYEIRIYTDMDLWTFLRMYMRGHMKLRHECVEYWYVCENDCMKCHCYFSSLVPVAIFLTSSLPFPHTAQNNALVKWRRRSDIIVINVCCHSSTGRELPSEIAYLSFHFCLLARKQRQCNCQTLRTEDQCCSTRETSEIRRTLVFWELLHLTQKWPALKTLSLSMIGVICFLCSVKSQFLFMKVLARDKKSKPEAFRFVNGRNIQIKW